MTNREHLNLVLISLNKDLDSWDQWPDMLRNEKLDCCIHFGMFYLSHRITEYRSNNNKRDVLYRTYFFHHIIFLYYFILAKRKEKRKTLNNLNVDVDKDYVKTLRRENVIDDLVD